MTGKACRLTGPQAHIHDGQGVQMPGCAILQTLSVAAESDDKE